jgi:hypothetical protein
MGHFTFICVVFYIFAHSQGLTEEEAARRLARDGENKLTPPKVTPLWLLVRFIYFPSLHTQFASHLAVSEGVGVRLPDPAVVCDGLGFCGLLDQWWLKWWPGGQNKRMNFSFYPLFPFFSSFPFFPFLLLSALRRFLTAVVHYGSADRCHLRHGDVDVHAAGAIGACDGRILRDAVREGRCAARRRIENVC